MLAGGGIPLAADVPYAPMIEVFRALAVLYPPAGEGLLPRDQPARTSPPGSARLLSLAAEALCAAAEQLPGRDGRGLALGRRVNPRPGVLPVLGARGAGYEFISIFKFIYGEPR